MNDCTCSSTPEQLTCSYTQLLPTTLLHCVCCEFGVHVHCVHVCLGLYDFESLHTWTVWVDQGHQGDLHLCYIHVHVHVYIVAIELIQCGIHKPIYTCVAVARLAAKIYSWENSDS